MIIPKPDPVPEKPKKDGAGLAAVSRAAQAEVSPAVERTFQSASVPARVIFETDAGLVERLDAEWHRRKLKSRSETIRVLLGEALR